MKLNVQDLIDEGLVVKKTYTEGVYKGLSVLKYHRKVFYNNLWHLDDRLLECRGTVVDEDWNIVVLPFKKVFNYGENGTMVDPEREVIVPTKINGFMAAATMTEKYGLIVSTTGTLDSDYAKLARKWIEKLDTKYLVEGLTYLFEICDKTDPHIVDEEEGAYLIGVRRLNDGFLSTEQFVDMVAASIGAPRPEVTSMKFKDIPLDVKHEGFMVRCAETQEVLCKLKSPHYLSKKALMRVGRAKVDTLFDTPELFKQRVNEEFYEIINYMAENIDKEVWRNYDPQQRKDFIERYYHGV